MSKWISYLMLAMLPGCNVKCEDTETSRAREQSVVGGRITGRLESGTHTYENGNGYEVEVTVSKEDGSFELKWRKRP